MNHIMYGHGPNSKIVGKGKFANGTAHDVKRLVDEAIDKGAYTFRENGKGGEVVYDFGRQIGKDFKGDPTTRIQVFFNELGQITTAYPF